MFDFDDFSFSERSPTQFIRPPYEILAFLTNFIFFGKTTQLYGIKSVLPFSKLKIGKSQVFTIFHW